jgi:phage FluMu protein Com
LTKSLHSTALARAPGHPQHVGLPILVVDTGQYEEQIGKTVQVDETLRIDGLVASQRDGCALGPPANGARQVQIRGGGRSAGHDEAVQGRQGRIEPVDGRFQPGDLFGRYAQMAAGRFLGFHGPAQIGAHVEEVVLNAAQQLSIPGRRLLHRPVGQEYAQDRIEFVHFAVRYDTGVILGDTAAIAQTRFAVIAALGVNPRQVYHGRPLPRKKGGMRRPADLNGFYVQVKICGFQRFDAKNRVHPPFNRDRVMSNTFSCPECNKVLKTAAPVPTGKKIKCPNCQAIFAVTGNGAPSSAVTEARKLPPKASAPAPVAEELPPEPGPRRGKSRVDDDDDDRTARKPRYRDEEDEERPARIARARGRDEEEDRGDDEDEDERAVRRKKKRKKSGSGGLLVGLLVGIPLVLVLVGVLIGGFVWPGFFLGPRRGTGQENLMAYLPANSPIVLGVDLSSLGAKERSNLDFIINNPMAFQLGQVPQGALQALRDSQKWVVAIDPASKQITCAILMRKPMDVDKIKRSFAAQDLPGKSIYRVNPVIPNQSWYLGIVNDRVLLWGSGAENSFIDLVQSDGTTSRLRPDIDEQVRAIQTNKFWSVVALDDAEIAKGLKKIDAKDLAKAPGAEALLPILQRARHTSFWIDEGPQAAWLKFSLAAKCGNDADAQTLKTSVQNLWNTQVKPMLSAGGLALLFQGQDTKGLSAAINDLNKTFQVTSEGSTVTASVQLSEQTLKELERMQNRGGFAPGLQFGPALPKGLPRVPGAGAAFPPAAAIDLWRPAPAGFLAVLRDCQCRN